MIAAFPHSVLGWLKQMDVPSAYQVTRYEHSLQAATRAGPSPRASNHPSPRRRRDCRPGPGRRKLGRSRPNFDPNTAPFLANN